MNAYCVSGAYNAYNRLYLVANYNLQPFSAALRLPCLETIIQFPLTVYNYRIHTLHCMYV